MPVSPSGTRASGVKLVRAVLAIAALVGILLAGVVSAMPRDLLEVSELVQNADPKAGVVMAHAVCVGELVKPPEYSCKNGTLRAVFDTKPDLAIQSVLFQENKNTDGAVDLNALLRSEDLNVLLTSRKPTLEVLQERVSRSQASTKSSSWRERIMKASAERIQAELQDDELIIATIYVNTAMETEGWNFVEVNTSDKFHDRDQMFAAGYIEGFATAADMIRQFNSLYEIHFGPNSPFPPGAYDRAALFIQKQLAWARDQMIRRKDTEARYMALFLVDHQTRGLAQGFYDRVPNLKIKQQSVDYERPVMWDPTFWQYRGEMWDILNSLYPNVTKSCWERDIKNALSFEADTNHCSAFGRMISRELDDGTLTDDFAVAHATWSDYRMMLRHYKTYKLPLDFLGSKHDVLYEPYVLMQSSYPGLIHSFDDYYMLGRTTQQLVVMETTNSICDKSLWQRIVPAALSTWQRVLIANLIARGGDEWTAIFSQDNSGTYNNQFMIYDMKQFIPEYFQSRPTLTYQQRREDQFQTVIPTARALSESELPREPVHDVEARLALASRINPGFLWIIEQMPGDYERADVTPVLLNKTYWASYNRPYFPRIQNAMGFSDAERLSPLGSYYNYNKTARAVLFAKYGPQTKDLQSFMHLMRYNKYQTDEVSQKHPSWSIAGRYDLEPDIAFRKPNGATDCKLTTALSMNGETLPVPNSKKQVKDRTLRSRLRAMRYPWNLYKKQKFTTSIAIAALVVAGPTNEDQPAFIFSEYEKANNVKLSRDGIPDKLQFDWTEVETSA